jgi:Sec-independent protein translocase protein TatA
MQSLGEGLGDALRTFRQAVADVRGSIDPEMRTIQAELDAAQKEIEQSVEAAKQMPAVQEDPPKPT